MCGSSYAHAPIAVCEALHFFKTRKLISLSVQQIIDCTSTGKAKFRNHGCDYGWPENVKFFHSLTILFHVKVNIQVLDYLVKNPKHGCEPDSVYQRDATKRTTTTTITNKPYHHHKTYG